MATNFTNYREDPELGDEQDPAYKEEIFQFFKMKGWTPEDMKDPAYAEDYRKWLVDHA